MAQDGSIFNPPIPCIGFINGGMTVGKMLIVQGQAPPGANSFSINLTDGGMDHDYIFHFNPRFPVQHVIRNSRLGGAWGPEELQGPFPFHHGQSFEVVIAAQPGGYLVAVNGQQFAEYHHRAPTQRATTFTIEGDVAIHSARFQYAAPQEWMSPPTHWGHCTPPQPQWTPSPTPHDPFPHTGAPPQWTPSPTPHAPLPGAPPQWTTPSPTPHDPFPHAPLPGGLAVPYCALIPGGLRPARMVTISGSTTHEDRFAVNFSVGPEGNNSDIGFHFNPRFDQNAIVRNSFLRGAWGTEERNAACFPFAKNTPFELMILVDGSSFKVAVNGQHFIEYAHRMRPLESMQYLSITGGVRLQHVQIY